MGFFQKGSIHKIVLCVMVLMLFCLQTGCFWKKKIPEPEPVAQELYEDGIKLIEKKLYEEARDKFNKAKVASADTELELLAEIAVADSYFEEEEFEAARAQYEETYKLHSGGKIADYLLYRIAECFFWQIDKIDRDATNAKKGLQAFERFEAEFPESQYLPQAQLRMKKIHTFLAESEFFIGKFYLRKHALFAAINRFKKALDLYPQSGIEDKLLFHLYMTYEILKDEDNTLEFRRLLLERYPNSEYVPKVEAINKQGSVKEISEHAEHKPEPDHETASARRDDSPGLAGTYQGKDKEIWWRKIFLLQGEKSQETIDEKKEPELEHRSFLEKIIPW